MPHGCVLKRNAFTCDNVITLTKICAHSYTTSPISCGDRIPSDTSLIIDDTAFYSFTITTNNTNIYFSSCGSDFDTYLSVYTSTKSLIKSNDNINSITCGDHAILHLSLLSIGIRNYILNISSINRQTGGYIIEMICNIDETEQYNTTYPDIACNHVYNKPVDVCQINEYITYKYICIYRNGLPAYPIQRIYNSSTSCTGEYMNITLKLNDTSYYCRAYTSCSYATLSLTEDCNMSFNNINNSLYQISVITDMCLPGNVMWQCNEGILIKQLFNDNGCLDESIYGNIKSYQIGCYNIIDDMFGVENITCKYFDYYEDRIPTYKGKEAGIWLLLSASLICFIFGVVYCRKKKRNEYKEKWLPMTNTERTLNQKKKDNIVYVSLD